MNSIYYSFPFEEIFSVLEKKYKDDTEALDVIKTARATVAYYKERDEYQKAINHVKQLEAFLYDWY